MHSYFDGENTSLQMVIWKMKNVDGTWMELPPDPVQQQALVFRSVQLLILH
jgi:hypothetical protein